MKKKLILILTGMLLLTSFVGAQATTKVTKQAKTKVTKQAKTKVTKQATGIVKKAKVKVSNNANAKTVTKKIVTQNPPTKSTTPVEKTFTLSTLAAYNGENGNQAYVAVDGIVYDVTAWGSGTHHGIKAGTNATDAIGHAPHSRHPLSSLPIIGKLSN
jgi:predicted heme/steroid binding protein